MPNTLMVGFGSRIWIFPLSDCDTWFKFAQNFAEVTLEFEAHFRVYEKARIITPSKWTALIEQARKQSTRIMVAVLRNFEDEELPESFPDDPNPASSSRSTTAKHSQLSMESEAHSSVQSASIAGNIIPTPGPDITQRDDTAEQSSVKSHLPPDLKLPSPTSERQRESVSPIPKDIDPHQFHVLVWIGIKRGLDGSGPAASLTIENLAPSQFRNMVTSYLSEFHDWFERGNSDPRARRLYQNCSYKTAADVNGIMIRMKGLDAPEVITEKQRLLKAAILAFQLFLPLDQQKGMCKKYWGALYSALTAAILEDMTPIVTETIDVLTSTADTATKIIYELSDGKGPSYTESLPSEFPTAWRELLFSLLHWTRQNGVLSLRHARNCRKKLKIAHKKLMEGSRKQRLVDHEAVLPNELVWFMTKRLLEDMTGRQPNVEESYLEHFYQVVSITPYSLLKFTRYSYEKEASVRKEPFVRKHQPRIALFTAEVSVIEKVLDSQLDVLEKMKSYMDLRRGDRLESRPEPNERTIEACIDKIDQKKTEIDHIKERAEELSAELLMKDIAENGEEKESGELTSPVDPVALQESSYAGRSCLVTVVRKHVCLVRKACGVGPQVSAALTQATYPH
ncbi:hypothetical protein NM208_g4866 [Fusarium decemcellulare]|uniref:Uncharacterized protein n=1 Tax=Fusarium decemcellulare TaxID=57161 RepID=A0ACC1SJ04_9HYPO|nr:hypothetical protein NM208_g4866 [Fusarium decemcellulare]